MIYYCFRVDIRFRISIVDVGLINIDTGLGALRRNVNDAYLEGNIFSASLLPTGLQITIQKLSDIMSDTNRILSDIYENLSDVKFSKNFQAQYNG